MHEHVEHGHVEVKRGEGSRGGQPTIDLFDSPNLDIPSFILCLTPASQTLPSGSGTSQTPPLPGLGFTSFQASHSTSFRFFGFRAPPPPGTAGSSTPHQPISQASSSDEEERADDIDSIQHYRFGHRVGKKTTSINNDEEMHYLWTIPPHLAKEGIHILVEFEHIPQQIILNTHDRNTKTLPEHIKAETQMVYDELSMLYSTVNNDQDEVDGLDGDDDVSSQFESDDDNDSEEGEFQTPLNPVNLVNPVTENIVQQWESSQCFSSVRYDYTHFGEFLDMGSSSLIDDLVESYRLITRLERLHD
ncbi:hypothetical protein M9H77_16929 [Catharanthus roseus]|uniref:Uncharacterized protein n=1 Tax=Catharanthus roseus TaxID=4058 RepID=A0ACC0B365_CATRO|nr:hypothetical protein M9H77_16929 [Catharanthus roseus]